MKKIMFSLSTIGLLGIAHAQLAIKEYAGPVTTSYQGVDCIVAGQIDAIEALERASTIGTGDSVGGVDCYIYQTMQYKLYWQSLYVKPPATVYCHATAFGVGTASISGNGPAGSWGGSQNALGTTFPAIAYAARNTDGSGSSAGPTMAKYVHSYSIVWDQIGTNTWVSHDTITITTGEAYAGMSFTRRATDLIWAATGAYSLGFVFTTSP
ncbi:MAG TPA: hypothetical protein VHE55_15850 [Fimbriimonadaceae bacterium]|nr:hypothetical protein [Fimbriimonadaceae bacterium]